MTMTINFVSDLKRVFQNDQTVTVWFGVDSLYSGIFDDCVRKYGDRIILGFYTTGSMLNIELLTYPE